MSVKSINGHGHKRRKLSHTSDDDSDVELQENGVKSAVNSHPLGRPDGNKSQPSRNVRASDRRTRNDVTMSTGSTSKSSVMLLQIDELLDEIRHDRDGLYRKSRSATDKVVKAIKSIPDQPPITLPKAEEIMRKRSRVAVPFGNHRPDDSIKYTFEYRQPASITTGDTSVQRLSTDSEAALNIVVQMPDLFEAKDYLNCRAIHKRAYYIACIAAGLKENLGEGIEICYQLDDDNDLVPLLVIQGGISDQTNDFSNLSVKIQVVFPNNLWPNEKTAPDRNCVRSIGGSGNDGLAKQAPTPIYNSTINQLSSFPQMNELLEQAAERCEAYKDACALGEVWLRQRGFTSAIAAGGFGLQEWAYICALLLNGGGYKGRPLFSERYSSLQLFKAMLQVLAHRDLTDPLLIRTNGMQLSKGEIPVIYDGATGVNVLFKMSPWSCETLKQHAQLSLTAVNTHDKDNFRSLFVLKTAESFLQFDEIYIVDVSTSTMLAKTDAGATVQQLYTVLRRGLDDRALLIDFKHAPQPTWNINQPGTKRSRISRRVEIHILVNPTATSRLIDHGPSAEQHDEAQAFRQFWGEKSELRRFRDGSITETLVWSSSKPVIEQIIQYLAAYHFKILPTSIERKTPDLELEELVSSVPVTASDAFKVISNKYQELSSKLHQLEGLPLPIRAISPTSQILRSTSIGHPLSPNTSMPIDVLIQFDSSARWPDHLAAVQYTKIAFLAKLSDLVTGADSAVTTRLGTENTEASATGYYNTSFLDVVYPSPAPGLSPMVFRLRIHHDRESHLLQNLLIDKSLPGASRDAVTTALFEHKRKFLASPIHTTTIRNLTIHFPSLSTTTRLLKRWIASHNLSNHVPSTTCEIIAAHTFLHPYPWSTPGSPTTAFLRCLHFLSHWDWTNTPFITDLSLAQDMPPTQSAELETRFQAWRKLDPHMNTVSWFIGTNIDSTGTVWTQGARPPRVVATRITALAKAALDLVKTRESTTPDWKSLFVSSTEDYDFVVYLKKSVVRGGSGGAVSASSGPKFKNLQIQDELDVTSIGHDAVALYLEDLERCFGAATLFFHGSAQRYIAGLWRPNVSGRKDWRVRIGYSTIPRAGKGTTDGDQEEQEEVNGLAGANKEGMLAEMALLGEGMIEKFSVKN